MRRPESTRRVGFTLLELMVAMAAGGLVISSMYFITDSSTNYFREQQRISNTQGSLRYAMDQVRRDIARAGFGATPNSTFLPYQACEPNTGIGGVQIRALRVYDAATPTGAGQLIDPAGGHFIDDQALEGDMLELVGNYATSSEYPVRSMAIGSVSLDPNWTTFTRDFTPFTNGPPYNLDPVTFNNAFRDGRLVRVRGSNGSRFFSRITGTVIGAPGSAPQVTFGNPINAPCAALTANARVNPVSIMRYMVAPAPLALTPTDPVAAGVNAVLVRREVNVGNLGTVASVPLAGTFDRVVAERVVHFDVELMVNQNGNRNQAPVMAPAVGINAANAPPEQIFSAIVTLALRTALPDPRFPWVDQNPGDELTRFRFNALSTSSTRVRVARTEIFLPNIAYEWMNN